MCRGAEEERRARWVGRAISLFYSQRHSDNAAASFNTISRLRCQRREGRDISRTRRSNSRWQSSSLSWPSHFPQERYLLTNTPTRDPLRLHTLPLATAQICSHTNSILMLGFKISRHKHVIEPAPRRQLKPKPKQEPVDGRTMDGLRRARALPFH